MALPKPRRRLNPAFVAAVSASTIPNHVLARHGGFAQSQHFSTLLHSGVVRPTALTLARLRLVAHLVGFTGPVMLEQLPTVSGDAFTVDTIPRAR